MKKVLHVFPFCNAPLWTTACLGLLHQRSHWLSVRRLQLCAVVSDTYINEVGLLQAECRHIIHWLWHHHWLSPSNHPSTLKRPRIRAVVHMCGQGPLLITVQTDGLECLKGDHAWPKFDHVISGTGRLHGNNWTVKPTVAEQWRHKVCHRKTNMYTVHSHV